MNENAIFLKRLFYQNIGGVPYYLRKFYDLKEQIDDPYVHITLPVIRLVLGDRQACEGLLEPGSLVEATIQLGQREFELSIRNLDGPVYYAENPKLTQWYQQVVVRSREEQGLCWLEGPGPWKDRLRQYLENPESLTETTQRAGVVCACTTSAFRRYLRSFIRNFTPLQLVPGKDYWLCLEKDGSFLVRQGVRGQEISCLSETEDRIFHYLCYAQLLRFWDEVWERCRFPAPRNPALLCNFADRLDESADREALYKVLGDRQILIFQ